MKTFDKALSITWGILAAWNAIFLAFTAFGLQIIYEAVSFVSISALFIASVVLLIRLVKKKKHLSSFFAPLIVSLLILAPTTLTKPFGANLPRALSSSQSGKNTVVVIESSFIDTFYSANPTVFGIFYKDTRGPTICRDEAGRCEDIEVAWESENLANVYIIYDKAKGRNESEMIPVSFQ